jgi:hypothetical protein
VLGAFLAALLLWPMVWVSWSDPIHTVAWFVPSYLVYCGYFGGKGYKVWIGWRWFDPRSARWVQPTHTGWRVRLEPSMRWFVCLVGLLILGACVSVVGLLTLRSPLTPPRWEVAVVMWLVGLTPLAILCWRTPPDRWLEVNEQAREIRWIHCRTGEHFVIPFSQIVGVRVIDARHIAPFAGTSCWFVSLQWVDGRWPQTTELARWTELASTLNRQAEESAEALADWLYERLGLGD